MNTNSSLNEVVVNLVDGPSRDRLIDAFKYADSVLLNAVRSLIFILRARRRFRSFLQCWNMKMDLAIVLMAMAM